MNANLLNIANVAGMNNIAPQAQYLAVSMPSKVCQRLINLPPVHCSFLVKMFFLCKNTQVLFL